MRLTCLVFIALALASASVFAAAAPVDKTKPVPADEVAKITAAAPAQARAKPEKPRRLLVFSACPTGFWHDSIPYGKKAIEALAAKTGAFEAVVSDDLANFESANLAKFDAVVFNNANNELFLPADYEKLSGAEKEAADKRDAALKKSFSEWLSGGKGLVILHVGIGAFRNWPEFGEIGGARFDGHPLGQRLVTLKVDDPSHPRAAAFKTPTFEIKDEIYQVSDPYSRDKLRVLVSIDTAKTDTAVKGINRKDGDFGMVWVKSYGKGRVFFSAFGHAHEIFWNPMILQHWLDGIQFALGDLAADTTPS
ncbi:MAG: ThuA domain-containing protein, partial [Planctomycetota bacterium]|nr:ThuA domain-containing protein [Planctomycetota bacterium]